MLRRLLGAAVLTVLPMMAGQSPPPPSCAYAGEGVVAAVRVLGLGLDLSDTGALPRSGGSLSAELLSANVPGLLDLRLLTASTVGGSGMTNSQASVANVSLSVEGIDITAAVLTSSAMAQACNLTPAVGGGSTIAGLTVNGLSVVVTGQPNQVIPLLVGSLIINEQIGTVTGSGADMVVNALHLQLLGIADVVISSSHAGVCSGANCVP